MACSMAPFSVGAVCHLDFRVCIYTSHFVVCQCLVGDGEGYLLYAGGVAIQHNASIGGYDAVFYFRQHNFV